MIDTTQIVLKQRELTNHRLLVTNSIQTIEDLRIFMEHHVFAVWDFMSLVKTLQHEACPSTTLWFPTKGNRSPIARMINEIVLSEESDVTQDGKGSISHFDLYLQAMNEIGANTNTIVDFINNRDVGRIPKGSYEFVSNTLDTIDKGPHCAAASFCYGRETLIPDMFRRLLRQLDISEMKAPKFHYYLQRHIEIDGNDHGPKAENLVQYFCSNDPIKAVEAEKAAIEAIQARIRLFDYIESLVL
jgi:hypothetical protein